MCLLQLIMLTYRRETVSLGTFYLRFLRRNIRQRDANMPNVFSTVRRDLDNRWLNTF